MSGERQSIQILHSSPPSSTSHVPVLPTASWLFMTPKTCSAVHDSSAASNDLRDFVATHKLITGYLDRSN